MDLPVERMARPWIRRVFVLGHATKGVVYFLVGGLAVLAAAGAGGKVAGEEGAVRAIGQQPFGRALLLVTGVGLVCYSLWRLAQAVFNLAGKSGAKGAFVRLGQVGSAIAHGALALTAFQLGLGQRAQGHEGRSRVWVAEALAQPFGALFVIAAGLGFLGFAGWQVFCALTGRLPERLDARAGRKRWVDAAGRIGLGARAAVFGLIGFGFVEAGLHERSQHARDLGGALRDLGSRSHGPVLLGAVAAGLAIYGIYQLVVARHGRVSGS